MTLQCCSGFCRTLTWISHGFTCVPILNALPPPSPSLSYFFQAFLGAHMVKNPPAMPETPFRSLGQEDTLEEGMASHSSVLAWRTHGQRSLVGYSSWVCKESDTTEATGHAHRLFPRLTGRMASLFKGGSPETGKCQVFPVISHLDSDFDSATY